MRQAIVNVDLDFFTKPYYKGSYYESQDWQSSPDFKSTAKKWINTQDFVGTLPIEDKYVRGCLVKDDQQPLFYWDKLIRTKWIEPKMFDIIHFDAHHDMYMWHEKDHYLSKDGLSSYHPFEAMLAPFQMGWVNNFIWVHPDYVEPVLPDVKSLYPNANVTAINWSDWNWNNHSLKFLSVVTNKEMCIINEGMLEDFSKIIQDW